MEIAGCFRRWAHLRAAAGFVLGIAAAGALVSALDGWLLAYSGGYSGPLVTRHLWGGVALAGLCLVAAALRSRVVKHEGGFIFFYLPLLFIAVGLMVWTSDQGGKITHGENFLTEYMPRRLRSWLHLPPPPVKAPPITVEEAVGAGSLFGARVVPIINRSCISCHNPKKIKGGLLLDSYAHLMKGGEDGAVVVPWYPSKSDLVRRVTLPQDDDDFMPNNGKNLLSPDWRKRRSRFCWLRLTHPSSRAAHSRSRCTWCINRNGIPTGSTPARAWLQRLSGSCLPVGKRATFSGPPRRC
jgi:hypothetical protein